MKLTLSAFARFCRTQRLIWPAAALIATAQPVAAQTPASDPVPVIFDTDMYSDIDDMLALAMLHALRDRREIDVLAITIGTDAPWIASYVDLVDTFYGHGNIPIGVVRPGPGVVTGAHLDKLDWFKGKGPPFSPGGVNYTQSLALARTAQGRPLYPHDLVSASEAEDAVALLRRTLAEQRDTSVVMIQVGYSTNFAALLASPPDKTSPLSGKDLVARKVKLLSAMAGSYRPASYKGSAIAPGGPEMNLLSDVPAARRVFAEWPTPIVASGFEIGIAMLFPRSSVDNHMGYAAHHPIANTYLYTDDAFRALAENPAQPHDHPTFDLTSVLYAARPNEGYFDLSPTGTITVSDEGGSRFAEAAKGRHRYLIASETQKARAIEAMEMLVTQPPVTGRPR